VEALSESRWRIELAPQADAQIRKLDPGGRARILRYLKERLGCSADPRQFGKALSGPLAKLWRYRVGDYRIIARIEDERLVILVVAIGHRREVYR
jgi:mRNA interferase RelE/StbE